MNLKFEHVVLLLQLLPHRVVQLVGTGGALPPLQNVTLYALLLQVKRIISRG